MSAPIISVYLGPLRPKWEQWCLLKGVKSSAALRQVVHHLISKDGFTQTVIPETAHGGKTKRIEIRLKPTLYAELQRRSQAEGFSPNRLISGLLYAQLTKTGIPLLGQYEVDALTESTRQLQKLGTNVNQLARQLNISVESSDQLKLELIEEISKSINTHTQHVAGLIQANMNRWSIK